MAEEITKDEIKAFNKHSLFEGRIAFCLRWYATEELAKLAAEYVRKSGRSYNGGYFHGKPCGREESFDTERDGQKLFAVSY